MTPETAEAIERHSLAIRRIPLQVVSLRERRHHEEGNTLVEHELLDGPGRNYWLALRAKGKLPEYHAEVVRFDGDRVFRLYTRSVRIPNNAGHWMCQCIDNDTSSRVEWSSKIHNLAPTLDESVALYLSKLKAPTP